MIEILKRNKKIIIITTLMYLFCFISGFYISSNLMINNIPAWMRNSTISSYFSIEKIELLELLKTNLLAVLFLILGGFSLGLFTFFSLFFNGTIFGILIGDSINAGISLKEILLLTFPHGVFELPATWLAASAGFLIAKSFYNYLRFGEEPLKKQEQKDIFVLSTLSIILIVVAAIVEAKITVNLGG